MYTILKLQAGFKLIKQMWAWQQQGMENVTCEGGCEYGAEGGEGKEVEDLELV